MRSTDGEIYDLEPGQKPGVGDFKLTPIEKMQMERLAPLVRPGTLRKMRQAERDRAKHHKRMMKSKPKSILPRSLR